ncbi:MAG: hypothetical protein ABSG91_25015 [Syntrophobacteraceae bacterium]|jgi:hypothetical protein
MAEGIREPEIQKTEDGKCESIEINFGPHYFVIIDHKGPNGKLRFILGATHHGFQADPTEVGGELEAFINRIRELYPHSTVD